MKTYLNWSIAVLFLLAGCAHPGPRPLPKAPPAEAPAPAPGAEEAAAGYARELFKIWDDADRDCRNTRQEILAARSAVPVTYRASRRGLCTVTKGAWRDFYYDETFTSAAEIDVDHVVPLKHAWDMGASRWPAERRVAFGNDPDNLVITNLKYNRSKGAKTFAEWHPVNRAYACRYARRWFGVKAKYGLRVTPAESIFRETLGCDEIPGLRDE